MPGAVVHGPGRSPVEGAVLEEVSLPHAHYGPATLVGLVLPEASAIHTRDLKTRAYEYGKEMRTLLYMGALIPARRYIQAQ